MRNHKLTITLYMDEKIDQENTPRRRWQVTQQMDWKTGQIQHQNFGSPIKNVEIRARI